MYLTKHDYLKSSRWALDGKLLPISFNLKFLLEHPLDAIVKFLNSMPVEEKANDKLLAPIESDQEVWACGVTYARSRDAREDETAVKDIYQKVYEAERPELFFKAVGWRAVGHNDFIRIRKDTTWNVPEPEMTMVVNCYGEIVGYCVGNDVSSRDIEGENPLYLPQAKCYTGSCSIGPGILLRIADDLRDIPINLEIIRSNKKIFEGNTRTSQLKRSLEELVTFLFRELKFPNGVFVMTGTGIVPPGNFTLQKGDLVRIKIDTITLENIVSAD
jgi:2-dehydro-3-deoxy-D-arabinonate dehydratase